MLCTIVALLGATPSFAAGKTASSDLWYLQLGRLWTGTGREFRPGGILLRDGRIVHAGKPLAVAEGTRKILLPKGFGMPAFVDAHSYLGVPRRENRNEQLRSIYPEFHIADSLEGTLLRERALREEGLAALYVSPGPGSLLGGWGALIDLATRRVTDGFLSVSVTSEALKADRAPTSPLGLAYLLNTEAPPVLKKAEVVRFFARTEGEVESALSFGVSQKKHLVLVGVERPDLLPGHSVPSDLIVIPRPTVQPTRLRRMAEAAGKGIQFAFGSFAEDQWHINLRFFASLAVAYGMPREAALRALTVNAARASGRSTEGILKEEAPGDIVIFQGDPLDLRSPCVYLFLRGKVRFHQQGGPKG